MRFSLIMTMTKRVLCGATSLSKSPLQHPFVASAAEVSEKSWKLIDKSSKA